MGGLGVLKCLGIAGGAVGWLILVAFVWDQYIPAGAKEPFRSMITACVAVGFAAFLTYSFGLQTYFRKREHEQIMKRYLDNGLDIVFGGVQHACRVFSNNFFGAKAAIRQLEEDAVKSEKDEEVTPIVEFERFEQRYLELTTYHKLTELTGKNIFEIAIHCLFRMVDDHSVFLAREVQPFRAKKATDVLPFFAKLNWIDSQNEDYNQKVKKYFCLCDELHIVVSSFEKQKMLSWDNVAEFRDRPEIKASAQRLRKKILPLLQQRREVQAPGQESSGRQQERAQ